MALDSLKVVSAPSVREMVAARLRNAIASGRFLPGERLVERNLCELTGVSRTSVREALRELETEGLVVVIPNKGPTVSVVSAEVAESIYQVREMLEGLAVRLFALRATDQQLAELGAAVEALARVYADFEPKAFLDAKAEFYRILLDGAGNEVAAQMLRNIHIRVSLLRATSLSAAGRAQKSIAEIRDIMAALRARDPEAAWQACTAHIRNAAEAALKVLGSKPELRQGVS